MSNLVFSGKNNVPIFLGCPKRSCCPSFLLEVWDVAKEIQGNLSLLKQEGPQVVTSSF